MHELAKAIQTLAESINRYTAAFQERGEEADRKHDERLKFQQQREKRLDRLDSRCS